MMIDVDTIFTFGKYKGEEFQDICADDPDYIIWLAENTEREFTEEAYEMISKL